ncbi:hypothetical protein, conserved [Eimeria tenella]|uniref:Uncharacterized protein n=1 Tax=Eimeria tenella TaxID=5802 RepID=U6L6S1_EIMTE|nr:hypothetical protein, conserved [Eimeria tenella]CDJ43465.1 hypothetical protein, conserved [Eimeria tenella]|eukprot:XP_013234215.1 hypothetical protein, conserved [Eimeria tenella]
MNATRGSAAERLRPVARILAFACSCLILVSSPCAAFEKWERPLGWNPQYGPRYVVFWGGPSGYKEPSLGTCSYRHFATSPEPAAARLSAFEDFGLLSLYQGSQGASFPPAAAEDHQQQRQQLQQLRQLPFLESHPSFRYATAPAAPLLQPSGSSSLQPLMRAAKAAAMEVCLDFLQRMEQQSGAPTGAAANKLEAEAARVFLVLLEAYEAQRRAAAGPSPEAAAAVAEKLQSLLSSARNQESWDSSKYAYWLEASSSSTAAAGGPYYLPDLEASLLASSLRALSLAGSEAQGPLGGPQGAPLGALLGGPSTYRDCSHLASSSGAPGTAAARQLLCADSFFAAAAAAHKAAARIAAVCSPRGQQLISSAAKRLQKALKANAKEIQNESPFKALAEQILKEAE